jgi:hypothetical protein
LQASDQLCLLLGCNFQLCFCLYGMQLHLAAYVSLHALIALGSKTRDTHTSEHIVTVCLCHRLVTLAAGAAGGRFLRYEEGAPSVAAQTAYGIEAEVEGYDQGQ